MDNPEILEEMLRNAEKAPEPGTFLSEENRIINKEEVPAVASSLKSAGYTFIYNTKTGDRSITNNNMLLTQLRKKFEDGTPVYTLRKPDFEPRRGILKCMLHPDNPKRAHYDELGLATCKKSNLTSPYQVKRHMQKRHRDEWATIEEERIALEKETERAFRESLFQKTSPPKPICDVCGADFGNEKVLEKHKIEKHGG